MDQQQQQQLPPHHLPMYLQNRSASGNSAHGSSVNDHPGGASSISMPPFTAPTSKGKVYPWMLPIYEHKSHEQELRQEDYTYPFGGLPRFNPFIPPPLAPIPKSKQFGSPVSTTPVPDSFTAAKNADTMFAAAAPPTFSPSEPIRHQRALPDQQRLRDQMQQLLQLRIQHQQLQQTQQRLKQQIDLLAFNIKHAPPTPPARKPDPADVLATQPSQPHGEVSEDKGRASFHVNVNSITADDAFTLLLPKLGHRDYYTEPSIVDLHTMESVDPGFCSHVKDFVVGRKHVGSIKFLGEVDVRGLDLESIVQFNDREVKVYLDEKKKPLVGQGLNRPAEVTLLNVKCIGKVTGKQYVDGPEVRRFTQKLMEKAADIGAAFVSFDPISGEWKFRVQHF